MRLTLSRYLLTGVAALFSAFHIALAIYSIDVAGEPGPIVTAIVLYAVATTLSLLPFGPQRMPIWLAAFDCGAVVALCLLVSSQIDLGREGGTGHATWYVAAAGTLLTIVATRRRYGYAWAGTVFLLVHTVAWAGWPALVTLGVVGSVAWVAIAQMIGRGMATATRDAQRFALAEREATDWQALQEAHVHERQFRLGQTNYMALAMLRVIQDSGGELTATQQQECLYLESAIRDEIRGRSLLNDDVRREVMAARRRGIAVTLLDEGGIDDLRGDALQHVLARLATAIAASKADRLIVRTVSEGEIAVTVVGLRSVDGGSASALGDGSDDEVDDEVELWLEIPRPVLR